MTQPGKCIYNRTFNTIRPGPLLSTPEPVWGGTTPPSPTKKNLKISFVYIYKELKMENIKSLASNLWVWCPVKVWLRG